MSHDKAKSAAMDALAEYRVTKQFSLEKIQAVYDAVDLDIKLDPFDKADMAIMALLLHLSF